ncbi:MAG: haloacid dehalogenase type II [Roseiflexaceae bacterium]
MYTRVVAFDVFGTIIDMSGLISVLTQYCGPQASTIYHRWRQLQVEYLIRRAAMSRYIDFDTLTADALQHTLAEARIYITKTDQAMICAAITRLDCQPETLTTLQRLRTHGWRCVLFSNATPRTLEALVAHNQLINDLDDVISVAPFKCYKPHPDVYHALAKQCGTRRDRVWLVSGNHWDVTGAINAGLHGAWITSPDTTDMRWDDVPVDIRTPSLSTCADYLVTQVPDTSSDDA